MRPDTWESFEGKRVLLLQGPVGPFFGRLSKLLDSVGAKTYKVNFNGGDWLFYARNAIPFRGSLDTWPGFLKSVLQRFDIEIVVLFGDCRPIHREARRIAQRCGVQVGVFEEGYVRPNYITFEHHGVNGHSRIPKSPEFYRVLRETSQPPEREMGATFWHAALWAILYYCAAAALHGWFRGYRHHRPLALTEAWPWLRSGCRKIAFSISERRALPALTGRLSKRFYLVPLQIAGDSQVMQHSGFASVPDFIGKVMQSFAAHAPRDTTLAIKHHPLDRGYHDYRTLLDRLTEELGITGRLIYIHDQHLPTLFEHMRGAVVINSTVGFSALSHGARVKTCGRAIYDVQGLTFQGTLDDFWRESEHFSPDRELVARFRTFVIDQTQINANFYKGRIRRGVHRSMPASVRGHA